MICAWLSLQYDLFKFKRHLKSFYIEVDATAGLVDCIFLLDFNSLLPEIVAFL